MPEGVDLAPGASAQSPQVTVLLGVYNGMPHLEHAIRSILDQSFTDFELLIVDDGSTDESVRLVREFVSKDGRVRLLASPRNRGLGAILAQGVAEARGNLVARMDADDWSMPQRLERQVAFLHGNPQIDVVGTFALDVDSRGAVVRERRVPVSHDRIVRLVWSNPFIHTTVMFRRDAVMRAGSYAAQLRRRQDYDLWFRCVHSGLRFANIPEPLVLYRCSNETLKRNDMRATWNQVRIGLRGCRLVGAPLYAYFATCIPLLESTLPRWLRARLIALRSHVDPRAAQAD